MRRGTLVAIVVLLVVVAVAAFVQLRLSQGERELPGPGVPTGAP